MPNPPRSLAAQLADAFAQSNLRARARVLARLIASVGSLALAVVGGGAFAKYIMAARHGRVSVSIEDAARTTRMQVYELARYVQQSDPRLFESLVQELAGAFAPPGSPA